MIHYMRKLDYVHTSSCASLYILHELCVGFLRTTISLQYIVSKGYAENHDCIY